MMRGTVGHLMRREVTTNSALDAVLRQAGALIDDRTAAPVATVTDATEPLVQTGWFVLQQLRIALGFAATQVDVDRVVPDAIDRAHAFGTATPASIGAAAALVDHVRTDDSMALARDIVAAREILGDEAVLAGAAALIAAFSSAIATTLQLDPGAVHDELCAGAAAALERCPATMGRDRTTRPRISPDCLRGLVTNRAG